MRHTRPFIRFVDKCTQCDFVDEDRKQWDNCPECGTHSGEFMVIQSPRDLELLEKWQVGHEDLLQAKRRKEV